VGSRHQEQNCKGGKAQSGQYMTSWVGLLHNVSLTHVMSFRQMTPRPVGLRALGVETPLRA